MTVTTETPAVLDTAAILNLLPANVRAEGALRLAAIAAATSEEERARIQAQVVNETLTAAKDGNWCASAEAALTMAFGEPEGGRWILADGFDRHGIDREGYDREGFHSATGRNRDGYDRLGLDVDGYTVDGLDAHGYTRDGLDKDGRSKYRFDQDGWDPDGFNREGFDKEGYNRDGFNLAGWNREGLDKDGNDEFKFDRYGCDRDGYNGDGYDYNGYSRADHASRGTPPRPASGQRSHPKYAAWKAWYDSTR